MNPSRLEKMTDALVEGLVSEEQVEEVFQALVKLVTDFSDKTDKTLADQDKAIEDFGSQISVIFDNTRENSSRQDQAVDNLSRLVEELDQKIDNIVLEDGEDADEAEIISTVLGQVEGKLDELRASIPDVPEQKEYTTEELIKKLSGEMSVKDLKDWNDVETSFNKAMSRHGSGGNNLRALDEGVLLGDAPIKEINFVGTGVTAVRSGDRVTATISALASAALNDLTDVTITSPSNGEILQYNGSAWVNAAAGGGDMVSTNNLSDLDNVATARTNLGVDAAGTDNSTDVTLAGEDFLSLAGQEITANAINLDNLSATGTPSSSTYLRGDNTWATISGGGSVDTSGTPVANDFARFTDADTIEGRSYAEVRADLSLEVGTDVQAHSAVLDATTASFTTADETKLDGIETGADVTDATNVNAAGATMNTDTNVASNSWVLDEDDMTSDDATKVPTQQSVKAYVDANSGGSGNVNKVGTPVDNQVGVWTGDGTIEGDADLTFNGTNLIVGDTSGWGVAPTTSAAINIADGTTGQVNITRANNTAAAGSAVVGYRAMGTEGTPTAVTTDAELMQFSGRGYDGSGWSASQGEFSVMAAEDWDGSGHGTYIKASITPINSTTETEMLRIDEDGVNLAASSSLDFNGTAILSDASGTMTLSNVDAVDSTTQTTLDAVVSRNVAVQVVEGATDTATGDGKAYFMIPEELDGMNLVDIKGGVVTAGTTGTTDVQIHNVTDAVDMLSTKLTIDSGETTSETAATAAVINGSNDDVAGGDVLRIDVDAVSTTAAQGLFVTLTFRTP